MANAPSKPSMNSWLRLPKHSWPCSTGSSCPAARRSVAFAALFTPAAVEGLRVLFLEDLPPAQRRLDEICAAGYTGRKRGEVVRTRTVVSQAHTSQWLGSFGNRGNGEYRKELASALGSSVTISRRSASIKRMPCCGWTASTALGPSLQIWMASAS